MKNSRVKPYGMYGLDNSTSVGNQLELERMNSRHDVTPPKVCEVCGKGYGFTKGHKYHNHVRCSKIKQKLHAKENKNE